MQSTLDKALFFYYQDNKLILAVGAHVDDSIGTGKPGEADKVLKKLRDIFDFGACADDREDKISEYGGKQITRENGVIKLTQTKFIQATSVTPVPKWRTATPGASLMPSELTELRSVGGCLHWLVGQTRPDLAAGTSLLHVRPTDHQQLGQPQPPAQRSQGQRRLGPDFSKDRPRGCQDPSTLTAAGQMQTNSSRKLALWSSLLVATSTPMRATPSHSWIGDPAGSKDSAEAPLQLRPWRWTPLWTLESFAESFLQKL